jgi:hypothetical protein
VACAPSEITIYHNQQKSQADIESRFDSQHVGRERLEADHGGSPLGK